MVSKSVSNILQRQIRSVGLAIKSSELQDSVIKWTKDFCDRKHVKLLDVHIVLFNSHNGSLAKKFVENKFQSMCLIESNQEKANLQKELFMQDDLIHTYHASIQDDLLAPPRSKILKDNFLPRILQPKRKKKKDGLTILIGTFPFLSQQKLIIESMLNQYLIHARRASTGHNRWASRLNEVENTVLPDFYPPKTIFQLADISLLTLVNPLSLGRLICANDAEMDFFARQHIHYSLLFNICFDVLPLTNRVGFDASHFTPDMIETDVASYEQRLGTLGYERDHFYPVAITPKNPIDVFNLYNEQAPDLDNVSVLLELACWLINTGKFASTKFVNKQIETVFTDYGKCTELVFPENAKLADVTGEEFLKVFPKIRNLFREREGRQILEAFTAKLVKTNLSDYAD